MILLFYLCRTLLLLIPLINYKYMKKLSQTTQTINLRNLLNSKLTVEQNENLHVNRI